eukprot:Lankesteria_metandrocarpae@DN1911_c0_g1_i1.p1
MSRLFNLCVGLAVVVVVGKVPSVMCGIPECEQRLVILNELIGVYRSTKNTIELNLPQQPNLVEFQERWDLQFPKRIDREFNVLLTLGEALDARTSKGSRLRSNNQYSIKLQKYMAEVYSSDEKLEEAKELLVALCKDQLQSSKASMAGVTSTAAGVTSACKSLITTEA